MYYPFLRGLQFELIAIRELAQEANVLDHICPIIEPVKESLNSLMLARDVLSATKWHPFLILNPAVGELVGKTGDLLSFLSCEGDSTIFRPAFIYQDNCEFIFSLIEENNLEDIMIICLEEFTHDEDLIRLLRCQEVVSIVLLEPNRHRRLDRDIKTLGKTYIRLDDLFVPEKSNSSYLAIAPHKFSEEHLFYKGDGFSGYSDFTLLPMAFQTGGWTPWAVAIHWSYLNPQSNNEIWVRHFTSETNETRSNIQGKFKEAAGKIYNAYDNGELSQNSALDEILGYYTSEKYPGLGVLKKLSIKNHILINNQYLSR